MCSSDLLGYLLDDDLVGVLRREQFLHKAPARFAEVKNHLSKLLDAMSPVLVRGTIANVMAC